jgi:hypothetical protein
LTKRAIEFWRLVLISVRIRSRWGAARFIGRKVGNHTPRPFTRPSLLPGSGFEQTDRTYSDTVEGSGLTELTHGFSEANEEWAFESGMDHHGSKIVYRTS